MSENISVNVMQVGIFEATKKRNAMKQNLGRKITIIENTSPAEKISSIMGVGVSDRPFACFWSTSIICHGP
jgi:hypothetical protein